MNPYKLIILGSAVLYLSGCARVEVRHVADSDRSCGVHFYEPRPYLMISDQVKVENGSTTHSYTSSIVYLPNKERYYVVKIKPGWGTVNGSVKLVDGWRLDSLGAQTDSKIPETITAVSGLVTAAAQVAVKTAKPEEAVGLYRIDIAPDGTVVLVKQDHWH